MTVGLEGPGSPLGTCPVAHRLTMGRTPGFKQWGCPRLGGLKESVPLLHGATAGAGVPHPIAASTRQLPPSWDPTAVSVWHHARPSPSQKGLWAGVPEH